MEVSLTVVSVAVAVIALLFSWQSNKTSASAVNQANLTKFFTSFDEASNATLENPVLLYDVHGLDRSIPETEARNIAYLSLLLDGFQHFYGELYSGDFSKMASEMRTKSTFLNSILRVPSNADRWTQVKKLYYGDFDSDFIEAIEDLMEFERGRSASGST